jgi:hypothetical protein
VSTRCANRLWQLVETTENNIATGYCSTVVELFSHILFSDLDHHIFKMFLAFYRI